MIPSRPFAHLTVIALAAAAWPLAAGATITISTLGGELIKADAAGSADAAAGSVVLLVADTANDGFGAFAPGAIGAGSFIDPAGNDLVLYRDTLDDTGLFAGSANLSLTAQWDPGDALALYWLPALGASDSSVGPGVAYGRYTNPLAAGSSAAWVTPADGSVVSSIFFSTIDNGSFDPLAPANAPASAGFANLTTVPEPSTWALVAAATAGVAGALRCRRRAPRGPA